MVGAGRPLPDRGLSCSLEDAWKIAEFPKHVCRYLGKRQPVVSLGTAFDHRERDVSSENAQCQDRINEKRSGRDQTQEQQQARMISERQQQKLEQRLESGDPAMAEV